MEKEFRKYVLISGAVLLGALIVWFVLDPKIHQVEQILYNQEPTQDALGQEGSPTGQYPEEQDEPVTEWKDRNNPPPGFEPNHQNAQEIIPTL